MTQTTEQIVECISKMEKLGAVRRCLVVLCGVRAVEAIRAEVDARGHASDECGIAPNYPTIEKWLPREDLVAAWRGEILGVPVLFDADCPRDYWRVERVSDWVG